MATELRARKVRTSVIAVLLITGAVLWTALPITLGVLIWTSPTTEEEEVQSWIGVEANAAPVTREVGLALDWQADSTLVAPAWSGTVTSVYVQSGSGVVTGTPLLAVDGIDRIGAHTGSPFFRSMARSDEGADVADLNNMLGGLGLDSNAGSDVFNFATLRGVRALAEKLKVPGASEVEAFDPGWVVFIAAESVQISDAPVVVGSPAPAPGETIFNVPGGLREVRLVDNDGVAVAEEVEDSDPGSDEGSAPSSVATGQPLPSVVATEAETLAFAGVTLELTSERDAIAPTALAAFTPLLEGQPSAVTGTLMAPATGWVVPSAAVRQTETSLCVVARSGEDEPRGIQVESVGSRIGVSIVTGALEETDLVRVGDSGADGSTCSP